MLGCHKKGGWHFLRVFLKDVNENNSILGVPSKRTLYEGLLKVLSEPHSNTFKKEGGKKKHASSVLNFFLLVPVLVEIGEHSTTPSQPKQGLPPTAEECKAFCSLLDSVSAVAR